MLFGADGLDEKSDLTAGMTVDGINELGRQFREIWAGFARDGSIGAFSIPDMMDIEKL